jgi:hypothetical protein
VALGYISQIVAEGFERVLLMRGKARVLASVFIKELCNRVEYLLTFSSSSSSHSSCF